MFNLGNNSKVIPITSYFAAGTAAKTSTIIDMQGYDNVLFLATFSTVLNTGVIVLKAQQNTLNQTGGMTDITGATCSYTDSGTAPVLACSWVDVVRPADRYLQCVLTPTVANLVINSVVAILYNSNKSPVSQSSLLVANATVVPTA